MFELFAIAIILALYAILNQSGFPVFLFHKIDKNSDTSPETFESMLKHLQRKKMTTLTATEVYNFKKEGKKLPKNSIMLTFDDGYLNNFKIVFPLLKKFNMKITLFLNTRYIHNNERSREKDCLQVEEKYCLWADLEEMDKSGLVDIQLHTHSHFSDFVESEIKGIIKGDENKREAVNLAENYEAYNFQSIVGLPIFKKRGSLSTLGSKLSLKELSRFQAAYLERSDADDAEFKELNKISKQYHFFENIEDNNSFEKKVEKEIGKNQELIEKNLSKKGEHLAWPWGHYTKQSVQEVKKYGVKSFYTCKKGPNSRNINLLKIRRDGFRKATMKIFKMKLYLCRNRVIGKIYELFS